MAPSVSGFGFRGGASTGQRGRRKFSSKVTEYFFREVDKGMQSPWVVALSAGLVGLTSWKFAHRYLQPARELTDLRVPGSRAPLSDTHNAFWGLRRSIPVGHRAETMSESVESDLKRPALVHSEHSETSPGCDWVVLELSEYDPQIQDDIYYRSVHSLQMAKEDASTLQRTEEEQRKFNHEVEKAKASGAAPVTETDRFLNPHIHGMVKCKAVSAANNCIPYVGHLSEEVSRKLMLALGPAHLLRDPANILLPRRFTVAKEAPVKTLICGLKSGELSRWLAAAFPNYDIDVVEQDGAIVKLARRFLGFREHSTLKLFIADPVDYARKLASKEIDKQYDLVVLDCVDGANRLSTQFGRLEFISHVRNGLTKNGMVAVNIPNSDPHYIYNVVQNWRMAFHMRTAILVHCTTSSNTIMLTFQDAADRGKLNFGSVSNVEEFRDIIHTQAAYYGNNRVAFDLSSEINPQNFRVLEAGREYPIEHYLPIHHPMVLQRRAGASAALQSSKASWWTAWFGKSNNDSAVKGA